MTKKKIKVRAVEEEEPERKPVYILDKVERDLLSLSDYFYNEDQENRGKEYAFSLIGLVLGSGLVVTRIGYGKVRNSGSTVEIPADTLDELEEMVKASSDGSGIVGVAHLHPFHMGHRMTSHTDREMMRTFGTVDPDQVFIIVNPISSEYAAYQWDREKDEPVQIQPVIVDTKPVTLGEARQEPENQPSNIGRLVETIEDKISDMRSGLRGSFVLLAATMFIAFTTISSILFSADISTSYKISALFLSGMSLGLIYRIWVDFKWRRA